MVTRVKLIAAALTLLVLATGCHHRRPKKMQEVQLVPVATLYEQGQAALRKKRPATARKYFDQISLREDAGEYKDKAAIATADSYYQEHNFEAYAEAISRYRSFLAFHPTHPEAPYCQYRMGLCYFEEVDTPDRDMSTANMARDAFQALLENYPNSQYAGEASKKLAAINDLLAAHEIRVGDWYLKDGHPKGAIARYRFVIERYPKYWNMPLVHSRLGEALYRDGQEQEALLYFKRIVSEAPNTVLAKNAQKRIERIQKHEAASSAKDKSFFKQPLVEPKKTKHWWQFWK
jgi:outer membrane protein assembly factor BamD